MSHLPAAEADGYLDLVAFVDKLVDQLGLGVEVVVVSRRTHPDLFQKSDLLILSGLFFSLVLLETVLTVIEEAAHRRDGGRGNLDEVNTTLLRHAHCLKDR